jgi:hypothetical protein
MRWVRPQRGAGTHRLFQRIANPWIVLTYNPYDLDGSGSSDAKSLGSCLLWCQYATLQKSGEEA